MNAKPNLPDEIWLGRREYSAWTDFRVNGWLFVATIISGVSDIMFPHVVGQWRVGVRTLIAVIPFVALLLWMRTLSRWIRGMDELHRRITVAAVLFTVSTTFFFVVLWQRLDKAGLFRTFFPSSASASWDIGTVGHIFLLMTFCYFLGYRILNRRFQ